MPRPRKFSDQAERLVIGIATYACEEVRRGGGAPRQPAIEQAMRAMIIRGSSKDEEAAVGQWFKTYTRPTRHAKLTDWALIEPARPARPLRASSRAVDHVESAGNNQPSGPGDRPVFESAPHSRQWAPWNDMGRQERLAFAGFLLEQDQLSRSRNLQRLGVVGISRFFDQVRLSSYDGMGYTPEAEIQLFAQGRAWGVLRLGDGEEGRLARRVYITWKGWVTGRLALVFWDGSSASAALGRRRAFTRWLSWFVPWLA